MKTDTSEKGLETLIMRHMTGVDGLSSEADMVGESAPHAAGSGWFAGRAKAHDREFAVDVEQLFAFLKTTQPDETSKLGIVDCKDRKNIARQKFLARLQGDRRPAKRHQARRSELRPVLRHAIAGK